MRGQAAPNMRTVRRTARGLSIVESLIAMMVVTFVVLALLGAAPVAFSVASFNAQRFQAIEAGQQYLEIIRQYLQTKGVDTDLPASPSIAIDPGYSFAGTKLSSPGNFVMTPACASKSLFRFTCSVTVTWSQNGVDRNVQVESFIASQAGF